MTKRVEKTTKPQNPNPTTNPTPNKMTSIFWEKINNALDKSEKRFEKVAYLAFIIVTPIVLVIVFAALAYSLALILGAALTIPQVLISAGIAIGIVLSFIAFMYITSKITGSESFKIEFEEPENKN